jgi:histone-lysine N-methyltransferase MLL3
LIRQSFPFRIGPITFQNFGLLPGDINIIQKYHSENYLYPIGFSSVREYWDVEEPSVKCLYVSEIRSGAEEGPTFAVYKALNREICFVSSSSSVAWKALLEQLSIAKVERGEIPTNTLLAVSGPDMYVLSIP